VEDADVTLYHACNVPGTEPVYTAQSDAEGRVEVTLDRPGAWMVKAAARKPLREAYEGKANEESYTATLTFSIR